MHGKRETTKTETMQETQESRNSQSKTGEEVQTPTPVGPSPTVPSGVEEELEKERERSQDYLRRLQYLQADFENYRKRAEREMGDVKRYGNERLLSELIIIIDELELGLEKAREEGASPTLVEGFGMILKRFQGLLGREGVARIEGLGNKFDPSLHEAALRVPSDKAEGTIIEEIRPGYTLKGRVLRPSIVKVAEGTDGSSEAENGQYKTENGMEKQEE